jgi:hypothetical protein
MRELGEREEGALTDLFVVTSREGVGRSGTAGWRRGAVNGERKEGREKFNEFASSSPQRLLVAAFHRCREEE